MMKTTRRKFIDRALKLTIATSAGIHLINGNVLAEAHINGPVESHTFSGGNFKFSQVALPYAKDALEPTIDSTTMDLHYDKHHAAYVKNVNEAITTENITYKSEKEFFSNISKLSAKARNNGGGAYNHNLYWEVMKPGGGGAPGGKLAEAINASFGSFEKFKEQFSQAATNRFGSGWAWLVKDGNKLTVGSTPNQDNPLMDVSDLKGTPLLGIDVWEHAYYLKYQNKRAEYVSNWLNVVNWENVAKRLG